MNNKSPKLGLTKRRELFVFVLVLTSMVAMVFYMYHLRTLHKATINEYIQKAAKQGPVHKFVAERYINCMTESQLLNTPSNDECVSRVLTISLVKGKNFQDQAAAAIRDLELEQFGE